MRLYFTPWHDVDVRRPKGRPFAGGTVGPRRVLLHAVGGRVCEGACRPIIGSRHSLHSLSLYCLKTIVGTYEVDMSVRPLVEAGAVELAGVRRTMHCGALSIRGGKETEEKVSPTGRRERRDSLPGNKCSKHRSQCYQQAADIIGPQSDVLRPCSSLGLYSAVYNIRDTYLLT